MSLDERQTIPDGAEDLLEIDGEWYFVSDWNPETETGDELVGPFDTSAEALIARGTTA